MIGSSVDYVRSGGMRNVPVTKAVEHLYVTTAKFSGCVILASRPAYSYLPRRLQVKHKCGPVSPESLPGRQNIPYIGAKPVFYLGIPRCSKAVLTKSDT
ncbi:hypothetical protein AVEN_128539-1 [Araneus ventricosus]|uniref:Uncharacterized protein n=1 Tax=Araneus ventricosus TaxID=182803 RepID=A0A4Y2MQR2_ARAVE|nr:hypothetical protein AVEN_28499-1 [Araneus ventricosus]GBN28690.1 hypothetical protein AVEN_128539-1 [Araneus ventricosus]